MKETRHIIYPSKTECGELTTLDLRCENGVFRPTNYIQNFTYQDRDIKPLKFGCSKDFVGGKSAANMVRSDWDMVFKPMEIKRYSAHAIKPKNKVVELLMIKGVENGPLEYSSTNRPISVLWPFLLSNPTLSQ